MQQFDKYIKNKLKDPEFCQAYKEKCNICQTVWEIVDHILASGKSYEDISNETGINLQEINDFAEGDRCQSHIINIFCKKYNISFPANCPRFKF